MPGIRTESELEAILDEVAEQTDRGVAIILTAILDELLAEALKKRLILTSSLKERLFSYEKNGPLRDFNAKIDMAFAVGLFSPETRNTLHTIRRIRNHFAHRVEPITFNEPKVATWCASLKVVLDLPLKTMRGRFLIAALRAVVILFTISQEVPQIDPTKDEGGKWLDDLILGFASSLESSP